MFGWLFRLRSNFYLFLYRFWLSYLLSDRSSLFNSLSWGLSCQEISILVSLLLLHIYNMDLVVNESENHSFSKSEKITRHVSIHLI